MPPGATPAARRRGSPRRPSFDVLKRAAFDAYGDTSALHQALVKGAVITEEAIEAEKATLLAADFAAAVDVAVDAGLPAPEAKPP